MTDMSERQPDSLRRSWQIQCRIIHALIMREMLTRFGRHNIGFLWMFIEPMMFTVGVTILWSVLGANHGSDLPIAVFALTGYSGVLLWRNMPGRTMKAIHPNQALMYHRNVRVIDIYLARIILEAGGATISFFVLSLVFIYMEWISPPEDILKVITGWFLLFWLASAVALLLGVLSETSELIERIWHPASYFFFGFSGAAFLVDALPEQMQKVVLYIPIVHCTEYIREGYFGSHFHPVHDLRFVIICNSIITLFAMAKIRDFSTRPIHL